MKNPPRKLGNCIDCGNPVWRGVRRCRERYLDELHRGPVTKGKSGSPVVESDSERCVRMDAKFCAAMTKAIEAGLEKPPEAHR